MIIYKQTLCLYPVLIEVVFLYTADHSMDWPVFQQDSLWVGCLQVLHPYLQEWVACQQVWLHYKQAACQQAWQGSQLACKQCMPRTRQLDYIQVVVQPTGCPRVATWLSLGQRKVTWQPHSLQATWQSQVPWASHAIWQYPKLIQAPLLALHSQCIQVRINTL